MDNKRTAKNVLWGFGMLGLILAVAALILLNHYEILEKGKILSYTDGTIYKVRFFDSITLLLEPEHRLTRDVFNSYILVGISFIALAFSFSIAHLSKEGIGHRLFWMFLILSVGMLYLAVDEFFGVHESIGHNMRFLAAGNLVEHPDDLIVLSYGLPVLLFLFVFRKEFMRVQKAFKFLLVVIIFAALAALADLLSFPVLIEEISEIVATVFLAITTMVIGLHHVEGIFHRGALKAHIKNR